MRKTLLFCMAAASSLALGGPVLAQSEQGQPGQGQTPAMTSSSSLKSTVTGTVVSSSDGELVIDTAAGRQRFTVVSGTSDIPSGLTAGTQVTVEFTTTGDQRQVARVTASPSSSTGATTSPSTSTSASPQTGASAVSTSPQDRPGTTATRDRDDDDVTGADDPSRRAGAMDRDPDDDALPATASPVGLAGILGLLALAGAAALRGLRRLL